MADAADSDDEVRAPVAPLVVQYCALCTLPLEYCEYGPLPDECRARNAGAKLTAKGWLPAKGGGGGRRKEKKE